MVEARALPVDRHDASGEVLVSEQAAAFLDTPLLGCVVRYRPGFAEADHADPIRPNALGGEVLDDRPRTTL